MIASFQNAGRWLTRVSNRQRSARFARSALQPKRNSLDPHDGQEQVRYWVTSRLEDTLEQVVGHAAQRWDIEVLFADFKELVGSNQYQMRSAQGIVRFWVLGWCLIQFLDEVRADHYRRTGERLTLGQARQRICKAHQQGLLDWIFDQIQAGATRTEIHQALQPAMRL